MFRWMFFRMLRSFGVGGAPTPVNEVEFTLAICRVRELTGTVSRSPGITLAICRAREFEDV